MAIFQITSLHNKEMPQTYFEKGNAVEMDGLFHTLEEVYYQQKEKYSDQCALVSNQYPYQKKGRKLPSIRLLNTIGRKVQHCISRLSKISQNNRYEGELLLLVVLKSKQNFEGNEKTND